MKQLLLEIDDNTEAKIKAAAQMAGLSVQQWLGKLIQKETISTWPESVKSLAGAWPDMPLAETLRLHEVPDVKREEF